MAANKYLLGCIRRDWLERIRILGITQKELCRQADVSYSTFRHATNPCIKMLHDIEKALLKLEA